MWGLTSWAPPAGAASALLAVGCVASSGFFLVGQPALK